MKDMKDMKDKHI